MSGKFDNKLSELLDEFKLFNILNRAESVLVLAVVGVAPVLVFAVVGVVPVLASVVVGVVLFELALRFDRAGLSMMSNGLIPFFNMVSSSESSSTLNNASSEPLDELELEPFKASNNVEAVSCCIVSMLCRREAERLLPEEVLVLLAAVVPLEFVAEAFEPVLEVLEPVPVVEAVVDAPLV